MPHERAAARALGLWHPTAPLTVYWACPEREEWAWGFGVAAQGQVAIDGWQSLRGNIAGPWFGGWAFDTRRTWPGCVAERWVVPQALYAVRGREAWAVGFGAGEHKGIAQVRDAVSIRPAPVQAATALQVDVGDRRRWGGLIEKLLTAIGSGRLEKGVAARQVWVSASEPFDALAVAGRLQERFPSCRVFVWRQEDGSHFVGASPETLCRVSEREVVTEALAGTAPPNEAERLFASEKDRREHQAVVTHLQTVLSALCEALDIDSKPSLRRLPNVAHLRTGIRGVLKPGVSVMSVARALHPTPAVAGAPVTVAMDILRDVEGFDRGWYTGALGYADEQSLELCVALRSALLTRETARVFVGAGVVKGSTADGEWRETQTKSLAMLEALGARDA
ncbi:MAG: isochorismate synthase [Myxococcaceae bacterium]|nr:isochorismate synthase [Myxococcaceae bacterium]